VWEYDGTNIGPPEVLIVREAVEADAIGDYGSQYTAVDCDMDNLEATQLEEENNTSGSNWKNCTGYRWRVIENPGENPGSISASPSAWAEMPQYSENAMMGAYATLNYEVICYNVRINYTGVLDAETAPKAMIGHAIRANVDLDGLSNSGAGFAWAIGGNGKFESYTASLGSASLDESFPTNLQNVQLAFAKVSMNTSFVCEVNLATPDLDLMTLTGKPVDIYAPDPSAMTLQKGVMDISQFQSLWYFGPNGYMLTLPSDQSEYGVNAGQTNPVGVAWLAEVDIPTLFDAANSAASPDYSEVCYVNTLKKVYRRVQLNNGSWDPFPGNFTLTSPATYKCDSMFPYAWVSIDGRWPANGTDQIEADSPFIVVDSGDHKKVEMDDIHEVFLLFLPYANGVARYYVPLSSYEWTPDGAATRSGSNWSIDGTPPHNFGASGPNSFPPHPQWSSYVSATNWP
jgi:hypothetical protein